MAQDDRIGLTIRAVRFTAVIGGRPSWRTRANRVRSIGTAPDWPCDFNLCSPPPNSLRLRRVVQAASASDRDRSKGASRTDHPVDQHGAHWHIGCPSWLHTSKQVCSLGPSRTRHANPSVDVHSTGPVLLSGVEPQAVAPW